LVAVHAGETRTTSNVDLVDLIDECVRVAELNHGVSAVLVHTGPVLVHADAVLLRRAIGNVLDNAARATGAGGSVTVTVESDSRAACVEVVDEGLGFGHVAPGSGQGLSIVDMALRACKGRLEITSGPGPGTTVRLLFPVRDDGGGHEPRAV
jgi:signal transduction histidine kinase